MCEDCEAVPVRYVAYFNKPGGKVWRPAQKQAPAWAIDICPPAQPAPRAFVCDDPQPRPDLIGARAGEGVGAEARQGDNRQSTGETSEGAVA